MFLPKQVLWMIKSFGKGQWSYSVCYYAARINYFRILYLYILYIFFILKHMHLKMLLNIIILTLRFTKICFQKLFDLSHISDISVLSFFSYCLISAN